MGEVLQICNKINWYEDHNDDNLMRECERERERKGEKDDSSCNLNFLFFFWSVLDNMVVVKWIKQFTTTKKKRINDEWIQMC